LRYVIIIKRKADWIGHILCRNCLLQQDTERKVKGGREVTGRLGRRRRTLLDDLRKRKGYSHMKKETVTFGNDIPVVWFHRVNGKNGLS
jgi:hypothetical protein